MDDSALRALLREVRTIAVVGMKDGETDDAFRVPCYLRSHGYRILPVNPRLDRVLGEPAVASLGEVSEPVDLVNVFRAPRHLPAHAEEILALRPLPRAVWLQLGVEHPEAEQRLRDAGLTVVQERCIMVEHRRLCADS